MKRYPDSIRKRVIDAIEVHQLTWHQTADVMQVSVASVNRFMHEHNNPGSRCEPKKRGPTPRILEQHYLLLKDIIDEHSDWTYQQLSEQWSRDIGMLVSRSATVKGVKKLGYTRKKNNGRHRAR